MKKIIFSMMILVFGAMGSQAAQAAFWNTKPKVKTPEKEILFKAAPPAFEANRKIEARAKEALAGKDWTVYLTPIEGKKAVTDMDVLTFAEGKFTSKALSNKGYDKSNFTITVLDNGVIVWETVQTSEKADMAAWEGQLEADTMRGIVSFQALKGKAEDFYFTNVSK